MADFDTAAPLWGCARGQRRLDELRHRRSLDIRQFAGTCLRRTIVYADILTLRAGAHHSLPKPLAELLDRGKISRCLQWTPDIGSARANRNKICKWLAYT
jgi:hypothetical protein